MHIRHTLQAKAIADEYENSDRALAEIWLDSTDADVVSIGHNSPEKVKRGATVGTYATFDWEDVIEKDLRRAGIL